MLTSRFLYLLISLSALFTQLHAQHPFEEDAPANIFSARDSVTKEELQGTWRCFRSYYDGPNNANRDDIGPYHMAWPEIAIFRGDSLFEYNYPCEFAGSSAFSNHGGTIVISGRPYSIEIENDTLSICDIGRQGNYYVPDYEMRRYVRDTVDPKVIAHLNKTVLSKSCITGTWILVTTYDSGYDGNGIVDINFPFTLPYTLVLSPSNVSPRMPDNTTFNLLTDGKLRPFTIEMNEDNTELKFTTQDWYKGQWPFTFTYRHPE